MFKHCCCCCIQKKLDPRDDIRISRAPEPTDVYWEHISMSRCSKFSRVFLTYTGTLLLICLSLLIIYILDRIKKNRIDSSIGSNLISIAISLVITLINYCMLKVVRLLSFYEYNETLTDYNISVAFKLTYARFINTAIVPIIVNLNSKSWFTPGGLV